MNNSPLKLFSGSSNIELAKEIAGYLGTELSGIELKRFKDGEISVKLKDNVRAHDVFIIQSTCNPSNDHIMELLLMIDAAVRASASRITAVIPYFGYARQDRKVEPRVPISAKVVSNIIQVTGADRVLTMDLHADQIQGFFDIPVDNLYASPIAIDYLKSLSLENVVVVSPDAGGVDRARFLAKKLNSSLAIIDKRRPEANVVDIMNVIGEVKGKNCILIDDIVDTAGSITKAAFALKERGANDVYCLFSHAVLSDNAVDNLRRAEFKEIIFTNSIPLPDHKKLRNMQILSIAPLFGEAIRRIHNGESVSSLFI
ncbi:MAG TPA: ribose-phosphate pyrophosphokinase [Spirochaetota bacterium]|jgi:ribose-phosphate pyrophosphokinase|nr:ribose-phosphate pyrophosphokinase [Spirochaetota bacterium]OQA97260.1 MAG: Ribose-phosphate pyrophosphokinase [Spirochaetes bacterium ADurb.Bin218]HOK01193.1 ribose-phosphate pyrophosphokinase [Spirochaetota bacterium]HOK91596.1 ribose-phosphate pyrophosphokinase [Spirochaetota bacterium]HON15056.1 ribose-phosphate pyrophosphokinase [Spirochaetota bacterium]